ncbi:MAG TPA: M1 family metallopeptidase [Candidatus Angelobacter sp.]|nr:M1 family metallopeptidase [Candidatus Angelobacter sp.]
MPEHYYLSFSPDLKKATFSGEETIDVQLVKPTAAITLNSAELQFQKAEISQNGKTQLAEAAFSPEKEQATLKVADPLQRGVASIHIEFTGILNNQLRGFYLAKTSLRNYAVTQFEATDARRAFPSFDEPALKATFDITLVVDQGDTAISNGKIVSDSAGPSEGKHTLKFSRTAKMSTYLVAMAVGNFTCNEGEADNIPIRVCGTPDKKPLGTAALRYAQEILHFYNNYYGIPYPFGKLDIVGAPDFEAGAMENTAAIFYRESDLFIDDKHSSVESHQRVFEILAHEMAHQWFGDLVTMRWWDNIWLNEGFATWMETKPSQVLHPEWNASLEAVADTNSALRVDSLRNTHPIRASAETPDEINEMFDSISYQKGAAILRMVESYVSPDVFRRGVNAYLRKYQYTNATAEDFWNVITAISGRPVDKIMTTFVEQPGVPLMEVKSSCVSPPPEPRVRRRRRSRRRLRQIAPAQPKTEIALSQKRFFLAASEDTAAPETWMVPLCVKAADARPFCQIIGQKDAVVPVPGGCSSWLFVNANATGYYRTHYDMDTLQKLSTVATTALSTAERLSLLDDEAALTLAGQENVANYLNLISALNHDEESAIVGSYVPALQMIHDHLLTDATKAAFLAWVQANFSPQFAKLGWTPAPGETDDVHELRGQLIKILGEIGEDPQVIQRSVELALQYGKDESSLDPTLVQTVLKVAATSNNPALFQQYIAAMSNPKSSPEQLLDNALALARFTDPKLMEQWLARIVSPETRSQDAAGYLGRVLENSSTQKMAWDWTKQHWPEVESKLTMSSGLAIVNATARFCDAGMRSDVKQFFTDHKISSAKRTLRESLELSNSCIQFRSGQQTNLAGWLEQHSATAGAGTR